MTAEAGQFFLITALLLSLLQASYFLSFFRLYIEPCMKSVAWVQALCVTLALAVLMTLRLDNDFSVANVIMHSNLTLPPLYKISGTWGNHEGSMLLWAWVLAGFGLAYALHGGKPVALAVQSIIATGVLLFILFTSNPFERRFPPAIDGEALNPLLQDMALAIHPPLLYLGYVGFSMVFSLAVAALIERRADRDWAQAAHPWILASWSSLTLGIGLGSWWAYRELGWGGWWFWDPVENASLMPWLAGTALLHANTVLKKRGLLARWVLLLSIVTFALSLLGTFLVRSGALTSVHSFASDPARGLFILIYIAILIGGALVLYALRSGHIAQVEEMAPVSREGMIVLNNLFILTACATVVLGTIYPLLVEWIADDKLTVGAPFFNMTFLPLMAPPLLFAGLVPFMPWKQASVTVAMRRARPAMLAALAAMVIVAVYVKSQIIFAVTGFGLAAWLGASSIQWLWNARGVRGMWALGIGHLGAAVIVAGITAVSLYKQDMEKWVAPGDVVHFAGFTLAYAGDTTQQRPNHGVRIAELRVMDDDKRPLATLYPEYRHYAIRDMRTSESSIYSTVAGDLYAVTGETEKGGTRTALRLYYVPMIGFIWAGFVLIACGGIMGLFSHRRLSRGVA